MLPKYSANLYSDRDSLLIQENQCVSGSKKFLKWILQRFLTIILGVCFGEAIYFAVYYFAGKTDDLMDEKCCVKILGKVAYYIAVSFFGRIFGQFFFVGCSSFIKQATIERRTHMLFTILPVYIFQFFLEKIHIIMLQVFWKDFRNLYHQICTVFLLCVHLSLSMQLLKDARACILQRLRALYTQFTLHNFFPDGFNHSWCRRRSILSTFPKWSRKNCTKLWWTCRIALAKIHRSNNFASWKTCIWTNFCGYYFEHTWFFVIHFFTLFETKKAWKCHFFQSTCLLSSIENFTFIFVVVFNHFFAFGSFTFWKTFIGWLYTSILKENYSTVFLNHEVILLYKKPYYCTFYFFMTKIMLKNFE